MDMNKEPLCLFDASSFNMSWICWKNRTSFILMIDSIAVVLPELHKRIIMEHKTAHRVFMD